MTTLLRTVRLALVPAVALALLGCAPEGKPVVELGFCDTRDGLLAADGRVTASMIVNCSETPDSHFIRVQLQHLNPAKVWVTKDEKTDTTNTPPAMDLSAPCTAGYWRLLTSTRVTFGKNTRSVQPAETRLKQVDC